jgi:hypothetical protein
MPDLSPVTVQIEAKLSQSAMEHVRYAFNPSKLDEVAQIKSLTAALITRMEGLMHKTIQRDELVTDAIRQVRMASMCCVLAATAAIPKES